MQSPYLFMCTSLYKETREEAWDGTANKSLAGSLVSSLHRLKDVDNKGRFEGRFGIVVELYPEGLAKPTLQMEGSLFFGDISVKVQGTFRLHFSLFDLRK